MRSTLVNKIYSPLLESNDYRAPFLPYAGLIREIIALVTIKTAKSVK